MSKSHNTFTQEVDVQSALHYSPLYGYRRQNDAKLLKQMAPFFKHESERFRRINAR